MGTSNWQNISLCVDLIKTIKPKSVLDIGVGFGRWGILCREFLDVWEGRIFREAWKTKIDGIEIFEKSIDNYHRDFYNNIYIGDAYEIVNDNFNKYDLIIMGDVLEHFDKEQGKELLNRCIQYGSNVMLNVPLGEHWEQDALYDNEYECHRSIWTEEDLDKLPYVRKKILKDYINREFATYVFTKQNVFENNLKNVNIIKKEKNIMEIESELLVKNNKIQNKIFSSIENEYKECIKAEELNIKNSKDKIRLTIEVIEEKNEGSKANECWIYSIFSDEVKVKDLGEIEQSGAWELRSDVEALTGELLVTSSINASISFDIIGKKLFLKCLKHPWSGIIIVKKDNIVLDKIDLYNEESKIENIIIEIEGND
ncbi:methyltransferase domain-containing protein [Clostridium sp. YIM B02555]|uniref:methyltransferase domain-containing protein n=1 Tax=Clostridium sp. YIM B02555 TaxID=2911968 RepID=UPI001EEF5F20|nr:methyltransferase domain-containing protein [Clostridium sp. YIM B02555]